MPIHQHTTKQMDFIPLVSQEYKYAFCHATNGLPNDIQRHIWDISRSYKSPVCPGAPTKRKLSPLAQRLRRRGRKLAKELFH